MKENHIEIYILDKLKANMVPVLAALLTAACGSGSDTFPGDGCLDCTVSDQPGDGTDGLTDGLDGSDADLPEFTGDPHEEVCADIELTVTPEIPTVLIVVDQSGSMENAFGSTDRWNAVRNSLLASPGGLIDELDEIIRFGLALYTSNGGAPPCPLVAYVDPDLYNYGAINAVYSTAEPIGDTPTGESIETVSDFLVALGWEGPAALILATDGEPDTCANPSPDTEAEREAARAVTIAAVERAFGLGIQTYVISVGEGSVSASHLQDIANAGLGLTPADPDAPYWVAGDDAALQDALRSIISETLSCVFELNGRLNVEEACFGTVELNDRTLVCDDPDGWRALDETHIEIMGEACDEVTSGDPFELFATFPCDVAVIL